MPMSPEDVEALFTRADGRFHFARWGRPLAPVVFGTDDATLTILKNAIRTVAGLGDLALVDADPEFGGNVLIFFVEHWSELTNVPNLNRLFPEFDALLDRLDQAGANQYRSFRFDAGGAISLCLILLRMDENLSTVPAQTLGTAQMVQSMLLWSDLAFRTDSPVGVINDDGHTLARPDIAALIRAGYDRLLPASSRQSSHAHRLAARACLLLGELNDDRR